MSFWKSTPDPEAVPAAVPAQQEGSGWWVRLKDRVVGEPEPLEVEEPSLLQQAREATTLNRTQRLYGFAFCLGLALLFGTMASFFFLFPTRFAVLYTLSNVLMISSTMFLMGPLRQLSKMFEKGRIVATLVYLVFMALTLFCAIKLQSLILTLLCFIVQLLAMVWYSLSFIPFAREMAWKMVSRCFS